MKLDLFINRHIGPNEHDITQMLNTIGVNSVDELITKTVPNNIRLKKPLSVAPGITEHNYLKHLKAVGQKNKIFKSYIGLGYYNCVTPAVIQRNILENPGWYTAYTPYQAEIAQGRLEALLNFQTVITDLTALPIANASLLDEATAAAEAMTMFFSQKGKDKTTAHKFFVSNTVFPQTINVLKTRALPYNIELVIGDLNTIEITDDFFGALLQYPDMNGEIIDLTTVVSKLKKSNLFVAVAADLLSLSLLKAPGECGVDCVVGSSQRFGVPLGYGGPHAAFFACVDGFKRVIPGRIIGVSVDVKGNKAYRMALQTREQHIKRDKATSNICTAQALLAIMAGMYAVYHGPLGIKGIALKIHQLTCLLANELIKNKIKVNTTYFFDTITLTCDAKKIIENAAKQQINFRYVNDTTLAISLDQTTDIEDINAILSCFGIGAGENLDINISSTIPSSSQRQSTYLTHPIFNSVHSETELMRYIKKLENKDLSLVHSMISLGSCTMKLNAAAELLPLTWPEFASIHPFVPKDQAAGYEELINQLDKDLSNITGFAKMNFQANSGAQGEYAGLMVIQAYHRHHKQAQRNIVLIPASAHGTNPASAAMAGLKIVVVKCDAEGSVDMQDLKEKAELHKNNLSCLMVTYPSTHGVYEETITEITSIIHNNGGLVYMDGANMNAQVGLTSPGNINADVCHLNLHKTFAIPHGGGGPGMGPIGVVDKLVPFLPSHQLTPFENKSNQFSVSAAAHGSALILLVSYGYIKMLGLEGLKKSTEIAILNANYIKTKLESKYKVLYSGKNGFCAHEMILDCSGFKKTSGVEVSDIAKRLMDYGFHAPTVSFPVVDTLMIEPTESESKQELDHFCDAMLQIFDEIQNIETQKQSPTNNLLKNAPHTADVVTNDTWDYAYTRQQAAYPLSWIKQNKFWPSVSRIDNAYGDRNLICSCPPISEY